MVNRGDGGQHEHQARAKQKGHAALGCAEKKKAVERKADCPERVVRIPDVADHAACQWPWKPTQAVARHRRLRGPPSYPPPTSNPTLAPMPLRLAGS